MNKYEAAEGNSFPRHSRIHHTWQQSEAEKHEQAQSLPGICSKNELHQHRQQQQQTGVNAVKFVEEEVLVLDAGSS